MTNTLTKQQWVWFVYSNTDYDASNLVTLRITGPDGTAWDLVRSCESTTTTTTTTLATQAVTVGYSSVNSTESCSNFSSSPTTRYIPAGEDWVTATTLYQNVSGTTPAIAGYYSDGAKWYFWDESTFTSTGFC